MPTNVKLVAADIALEIRAKPHTWTRGRLARDKDSNPVDPNSPEAVCWCLLGHIEKRVGPVHETPGYEMYKALIRAMPEPTAIEVWNDQRGRVANDAAALCEAVANG